MRMAIWGACRMYCVVFPGSKTQTETQKSKTSGERMTVFPLWSPAWTWEEESELQKKPVGGAPQSADPAAGLSVCLPALLIMGFVELYPSWY